ncbi:MAG: hypothetical protein ACK4S4_08355 [Pyrinomonadaceae bacterium]
MSKTDQTAAAAILAVVMLCFSTAAAGRSVAVKISVHGSEARVEGRFLGVSGIRNLTFVDDLAGVRGLAARVRDAAARARDGRELELRRLLPGEYVAVEDISEWSYSLDLSPQKSAAAAAHASWLATDRGVLYLYDLLPRMPRSAGAVPGIVNLELPDAWSALTESGAAGGSVRFEAPDDAVIFVGRDLRAERLRAGRIDAFAATVGTFKFSDRELHDTVIEIYSQYEGLFGSAAGAGPFAVVVTGFPNAVPPGSWEADTRGRTLMIVSSDMPFKSQSIQRLHEQLRHELFHLWLPNGVTLTGAYDWFYEGFALYQSLKLAVSLNRIRFEDMLDTLARAHGIDTLQTQRPSLADASRVRVATSANTQVYARGMLVAFLCDLAMLERSKGRSSSGDLVRAVFEKYRRPAASRDGTEAVLELMRSRPELTEIVDRYVTGRDEIGWDVQLRAAGLESARSDFGTTLRVVQKPSARQKAVLDKLGYNSWRKLPVNPR